MQSYTLDLAREQAATALSKALGEPVAPAEIRYPPPDIPGDLAYPCFALAKTRRKNPAQISTELMGSISFGDDSLISRAESKGPYLNFHYDDERFFNGVVEDFLAMGDEYGRSSLGAGKKVVVDFSSPNIAKPFSVGHLRSTNIGNALCHMLRFVGYDVIGDNHLGDWGTQFGKLITAYKRWGDPAQVESDPIRELLKLYTRFHEEAGVEEEDVETGQNVLQEEARAYFRKLEEGDPEIVKLWEWFRDVSLRDFQRVYDMLHISFEAMLGESFYNDKMGKVIEMASEKGILERDRDGALLVRLDSYGIETPLLIQKKDGASLYATRDLACALYRAEKWNPEMILYVVGEEQQFYFRQIFSTLDRLGIGTRCEHVYFGLIVLPEGGKFSTRKGNVIFLEDVIQESIARARSIIEERDFPAEKKDEIARSVGIGAIKYHDLSQNRKKNVTFEWDKMLSLDGNSSPYLQYSYARARSILRKSGVGALRYSASLSFNDEEKRLLSRLSRFHEVVREAVAQLYPHMIATYLFELAQQFSSFYNNVPVLGVEDGLMNNRLILVDFFSRVMKQGLGLFGISVLEEM